MAINRDILLRILGDGDDARRELKQTRDDLAAFGQTTAEARAEIKSEAAELKLKTLKERLERLSMQEASPKVTLQMGRTIEQIERLEARLAKLDRQDINVDVDIGRGGLSSLLGGLRSLGGGLNTGVDAITGGLRSIGPLANGAAIALGAVLAPALAAVGASLASAAAGLGALATAAAGAAGSGFAVFLATMGRVKAVIEAINDDTGELMKKLNPTERGLARAFQDISKAFRGAFGPATNAAIRGISRVVEAIADTLRSPAIRRALTGIGEAFEDVGKIFARELGRREFRSVFRNMADGAADLARVLGRAVFRDAFRIFMRIADVALPLLVSRARAVGRAFSGLEDATRDTERLRRIVRRVVDSLDDWVGLIKEVARLFLNFFTGAVDGGDNLVESLKKVLDRWNDFLETEEGQRKLKQTISDIVDTTKQVAHWFSRIVYWISEAIRLVHKFRDALGKGPLLRLGEIIADNKSGPSVPNLLGGLLGSNHAGGFIGGMGDIPRVLEGGEYVLRKSIVEKIGVARLSALNATGSLPAGAAAIAGAAGETHFHVTHADPLALAVQARRHTEQQQRRFSNVNSPRQ